MGDTGLQVSRVALGTLTWSRDTPAEDAGSQLDAFMDAGGTLVYTAAAYAGGGAESVIGALVGDTAMRSDIQICTKAGYVGLPDRAVDASRSTLLDSLDASLRRLRTDYVDLWLVHGYDATVALEETMRALEIAVTSGRARYVGVSNFPGWAMAAAATHSTDALAAHHVEYSLMERGTEREVIPAAGALGTGIMAWAALGRGVLTGKYRAGIPADSRAASEHLARFVEPYLDPRGRAIVEAVATAAEGLGTTTHALALAWVRDAPGVTSAVVGARTVQQLMPSLEAEKITLPGEIRTALSDVSAPAIGYPERPHQGL